MSEQGLKNKTLKGVTWTAAETVIRYGITFIVGIQNGSIPSAGTE